MSGKKEIINFKSQRDFLQKDVSHVFVEKCQVVLPMMKIKSSKPPKIKIFLQPAKDIKLYVRHLV